MSLCCSSRNCLASLLSFLTGITFIFHLIGFVSPHWMCNGRRHCSLVGLFYKCTPDCIKEVPDRSLLVLTLLVMISNVVLKMTFCIVLHIYRYQKLPGKGILGLSGWYTVQEFLSLTILIVVLAKYDRTGWATYIFTIPGITVMVVIIIILFLLYCLPEILPGSSVEPESPDYA